MHICIDKGSRYKCKACKNRVDKGGHDVPSEKIRARYSRAMKLFPKLFEVCDECYVYDNSRERDEGEPEMVISFRYGELKLMPNVIWTRMMLEKLCQGIYGEE